MKTPNVKKALSVVDREQLKDILSDYEPDERKKYLDGFSGRFICGCNGDELIEDALYVWKKQENDEFYLTMEFGLETDEEYMDDTISLTDFLVDVVKKFKYGHYITNVHLDAESAFGLYFDKSLSPDDCLVIYYHLLQFIKDESPVPVEIEDIEEDSNRVTDGPQMAYTLEEFIAKYDLKPSEGGLPELSVEDTPDNGDPDSEDSDDDDDYDDDEPTGGPRFGPAATPRVTKHDDDTVWIRKDDGTEEQIGSVEDIGRGQFFATVLDLDDFAFESLSSALLWIEECYLSQQSDGHFYKFQQAIKRRRDSGMQQ